MHASHTFMNRLGQCTPLKPNLYIAMYGLKELLMHVPEPTGYQAFVGLLRNLNYDQIQLLN